MKLKLSVCSVVVTMTGGLLVGSELQAAALFEDNFDGPQYSYGFVLAPGTLTHGIWLVNNLNDGIYSGVPDERTNVTVDQSLSPDRSLALNVAGPTDQAQVIGLLSANGLTRSQTTDAVNIRFAFNRSSMLSTDGPTVFTVRDNLEQNMSVVSIGVNGRIDVLFGSCTQELSPITSDTWYYLNVEMSANPGTSIEYKVSLFGADGVTLLDSVTGSSAGSAGASYNYFSIYNSGQVDPLTTYIDSVSVQTVPEPSTIGMAVAGVVEGVLLARRKK
jgi:hypothetical protein